MEHAVGHVFLFFFCSVFIGDTIYLRVFPCQRVPPISDGTRYPTLLFGSRSSDRATLGTGRVSRLAVDQHAWTWLLLLLFTPLCWRVSVWFRLVLLLRLLGQRC